MKSREIGSAGAGKCCNRLVYQLPIWPIERHDKKKHNSWHLLRPEATNSPKVEGARSLKGQSVLQFYWHDKAVKAPPWSEAEHTYTQRCEEVDLHPPKRKEASVKGPRRSSVWGHAHGSCFCCKHMHIQKGQGPLSPPLLNIFKKDK